MIATLLRAPRSEADRIRIFIDSHATLVRKQTIPSRANPPDVPLTYP